MWFPVTIVGLLLLWLVVLWAWAFSDGRPPPLLPRRRRPLIDILGPPLLKGILIAIGVLLFLWWLVNREHWPWALVGMVLGVGMFIWVVRQAHRQ